MVRVYRTSALTQQCGRRVRVGAATLPTSSTIGTIIGRYECVGFSKVPAVVVRSLTILRAEGVRALAPRAMAWSISRSSKRRCSRGAECKLTTSSAGFHSRHLLASAIWAVSFAATRSRFLLTLTVLFFRCHWLKDRTNSGEMSARQPGNRRSSAPASLAEISQVWLAMGHRTKVRLPSLAHPKEK